MNVLRDTLPQFQYRKRYEITCDAVGVAIGAGGLYGFNTASGMRSHVTAKQQQDEPRGGAFQYRKRYEITCDNISNKLKGRRLMVSIPQAV